MISAWVPSLNYAHGRIEEVAVLWAERYQRATRLVAQAVVVSLQTCGSVSQAAKVMWLHWHTVIAMMKAAPTRADPIPWVGRTKAKRRWIVAGDPSGHGEA